MRLKSLDVFRGIAIASMILVNNPGSWEQVYPPLEHAEWHGCTPTDLVFPFFLFIVGCAMSFSLSKYTLTTKKSGAAKSQLLETEEQKNADKKPASCFLLPASNIYWRIARRAAILFILGLLLNTSSIALDVVLNSAPVENFGKIRIMGVLQRIGLAYFISAIAILNLSPRNQKLLAVAVLLGYWGALTVFAVGGYTAGELTPEGNLGGYVDRLILGSQHLYKGGPFDPEGLLSTLPAVVTVLIRLLYRRMAASTANQNPHQYQLSNLRPQLRGNRPLVGIFFSHQQTTLDEFLCSFYCWLGVAIASSLLRNNRSAGLEMGEAV
jgi:predicted acyltransferase